MKPKTFHQGSIIEQSAIRWAAKLQCTSGSIWQDATNIAWSFDIAILQQSLAKIVIKGSRHYY